MRLLLILFLWNAPAAVAQGHFSHYLESIEGNRISFETKTFNDTILVLRDDSLAFSPKRRDYHFKFKVDAGDPVLFEYSRRLGGADPDYNCKFPKKALRAGDSNEVVVCFPGRIFTPPYILTRKYITNSNTEKRDTLTINRVFKWAGRDTICEDFILGDSTVTLVEHRVKTKPNIIYLNVHENEATSIAALKKIADSLEIDYYYLQHGGTRRIEFSEGKKHYSIDPNRIYTEIGREATLEENDQNDEFGREKTAYLAQRLLWKLQLARAIVSVHNNTPDEYSILSYLPEGSEAENTGKLYINEKMDPDDFIYTTNEYVFEAAKYDSINVILQGKKDFVDDGSLSIYCGMENIHYVNIETEHEHLDEQVRLILWIREIMEDWLEVNE